MDYLKTKTIYLAFLAFFGLELNAQKLDLPDLQNLTAKSPETANTFLLPKGWEFIGSEKASGGSSMVIRWEFTPNGKIESSNFLELSTGEKQPGSLTYHFNQKDYYLTIVSQFATNGYKLVLENIENQKVTATYAAPNFSLTLSYARESREGKEFTSYEISLTRKTKSASATSTTAVTTENTSEKKKELDENGVLIAEYYMKDGKREGPIAYFFPDGKIKKEAVMKGGLENGPVTLYAYDQKTQKLISKTTGSMTDDSENGVWLTHKINDQGTFPYQMFTFENGVRQGEFRKITNDSLILMRYKNDMREGDYRVFLLKDAMTKVNEADTIQLTKIDHGFYVEDKKIGLWKNFDRSGSLVAEGYFLNDAKTGKWKYFYPSTAADSNIPSDYSGKLYLEEHYKETKRNGESIRYSFLRKEEIDCPGASEKKCYRYVFDNLLEKSNLTNNVLNGDYELTDNENKIVKKGFYLDGKETGKWTLRNDSPIVKRDKKSTESGVFQVGMKEGKWERVDDNNQVIESYNYADGVLNGEYVLIENNAPVEKWQFEKGKFSGLEIGANPSVIYALSDIADESYICKKTEKNPNGICITTFSVRSAVPKLEKVQSYKTDFEQIPETIRLLSGPYSLKDSEGKILEEGNYLENKKSGTWSTYYYDQKVKTEFLYAGGNVIKEKYFDLKKNEPFSGEFIYKEKNSQNVEERKIKDGVRNGTTRYKDANDKTIKKESYKDGVLKE